MSKADKLQLKADLQAQKESQIAAEMAASLGYSNHDDSQFIWAKKRRGLSGLSNSDREAQESARKRNNQEELDRLRKKRAQREIEMAAREAESLRQRREQNSATLAEWEAKEDEFQLDQGYTRAQIRVKEGRAKPIDILVIQHMLAIDRKVVAEFEELGLDVPSDEPYALFDRLSLGEIQDFYSDIQSFLKAAKDDETAKYWESMLIICDHELGRQKKSVRSGVSDSIARDIDKMFKDKSLDQLVTLQRQIETKLKNGGPVDVDYWEAALRSLLVWKSKSKLRAMHQVLLKKRLAHLKAIQSEPRPESKPSRSVPIAKEESHLLYPFDPSMAPKITEGIPPEYETLDILLPEEEQAQLDQARKSIMDEYAASTGRKDLDLLAQVVKDAGQERDGFDEVTYFVETTGNDRDFDEALIQGETYHYQDKYRPRKPRYYNRVQTGFEWNEYNKTHYDSENPPPKVVLGYKFSLFYPDLMDPSVAPTYRVDIDPGSPDTRILRFMSGPPYEDVAFKIMDGPWEFSHKRGFKCVFDRGVLQLWFSFKRESYVR